jgi:hypothetical protein
MVSEEKKKNGVGPYSPVERTAAYRQAQGDKEGQGDIAL